MDREKVIKALNDWKGFGWGEVFVFHHPVLEDALALLKEQQQQIWELQDQVEYLTDKRKEQEAVEPKKTAYQRVDHTIAYRYRCGTCDMSIFPSYKYCPFCGQAVKWE